MWNPWKALKERDSQLEKIKAQLHDQILLQMKTESAAVTSLKKLNEDKLSATRVAIDLEDKWVAADKACQALKQEVDRLKALVPVSKDPMPIHKPGQYAGRFRREGSPDIVVLLDAESKADAKDKFRAALHASWRMLDCAKIEEKQNATDNR